ncbi:MAG: hypothetical protein ACRCXD_09815 [Luteolibacter sp.]
MLTPKQASQCLRGYVFEHVLGRFDLEDEKTVLELPFTRPGDFSDAEWTRIHQGGWLMKLLPPV